MPEGDTPMRGPAAPPSPGARDARAEILLGTPALTAAAVEEPPSGIVRAPGAATATPPRPHPTDPAPQENREERPAEPPPAHEPPMDHATPDTPPTPPAAQPTPTPPTAKPEAPTVHRPEAPAAKPEAPTVKPAPPAAHKPETPAVCGPEAGPGPETSGRETTCPAASGPDAPGATPPRPATAAGPAQAPSDPDGTGAGPVRAQAPAAPPPAAVRPAVTAAPAPTPRPRHGTADPVKVLLHRHRELCERAVDPLEVAAGLEAQGFTDRTAARYRHRDVFSLAEELYARVPRRPEEVRVAEDRPEPVAPWALAVLAPGAVAALAWLGLALTHGPVRAAVGAAGALALGGALFLAVRRGPLRAPGGRTVPAARLWTLWLLAYAVGGDGLLAEVLTGGPDDLWELTPGPLLGLALAVAPAAWCAHLFARRARRRIADSRGLADFAAAVRPLLLGTVTLQLLALAALLLPTGAGPGALALGALLLLARLLTVHGHSETASAALAAACAAEVLALASVLSSRLPVPGFDALAVPVRAVTDAWGPGAVPTLVCGAAALGLLAHATGSLARASAHTTP
ncbi:hypothetical protein ACOZE3_29355 [Streptomyces cinereoruber]|uniref:hypothetical protein n=1 Tax=Streptomyces cinereoruber TaxID=67260 RepID=UPI003BF51EBC